MACIIVSLPAYSGLQAQGRCTAFYGRCGTWSVWPSDAEWESFHHQNLCYSTWDYGLGNSFPENFDHCNATSWLNMSICILKITSQQQKTYAPFQDFTHHRYYIWNNRSLVYKHKSLYLENWCKIDPITCQFIYFFPEF